MTECFSSLRGWPSYDNEKSIDIYIQPECTPGGAVELARVSSEKSMATLPSMMATARAGSRESGRIAMSIYAGIVLQQRNDWIAVFSGYIRSIERSTRAHAHSNLHRSLTPRP